MDVQIGKRLLVEEFVHVQDEVRQHQCCDWMCEDHIDGLHLIFGCKKAGTLRVSESKPTAGT